MLQRVSTIVFVLLAACLTLSACEDKKDPAAKSENAAEGEKQKTGPEEEMLAAMQEVGDLVKANIDDPDKAIAVAGEYHTKNEARLKGVMEAMKARDASLSPEDQEKSWKDFTARREYNHFYDVMDQFEKRYPERYVELEDLMNTVQSAGDENDAVEVADDKVDVQATFDAAEKVYGEVEQLALSGASLEELDAAFVGIAKKTDTAYDRYQTVFQHTDDAELGLRSLVRAADLYSLVAQKIETMPEVGGIDAEALKLAKQKNVEPLRARAAELFKAAAASAAEKGIDNEDSKRALAAAAPSDGAPAPSDAAPAPSDAAPAPSDAAPAPSDAAPAPSDGTTPSQEAPSAP